MVGTIQGRPANRDAMIGRLDDGILLGMEAPAKLVALTRRNGLLLPKAADIQTVLQAGGSSVVSCGQDFFVSHQDSTHLPSKARRPFSDEMGDIHEVFVPGRPGGIGHGHARWMPYPVGGELDVFFVFSRFQG